jgi:hypothetical protein
MSKKLLNKIKKLKLNPKYLLWHIKKNYIENAVEPGWVMEIYRY